MEKTIKGFKNLKLIGERAFIHHIGNGTWDNDNGDQNGQGWFKEKKWYHTIYTYTNILPCKSIINKKVKKQFLFLPYFYHELLIAQHY